MLNSRQVTRKISWTYDLVGQISDVFRILKFVFDRPCFAFFEYVFQYYKNETDEFHDKFHVMI